MKYPAMKGGSKYRVEVPQLSGGTNLADAVQRVEDNQLTDSLNVWWHDNVLQTRPGLQKTGDSYGTGWTKTTVQVLNEQETFLIHWNDLGSGSWTFLAELLSVRDTPSFTRLGTGQVTVATTAPNALLVRAPRGAGTDWYAILPDKILQHYTGDADPGAEEWTEITDYYVPTVLVSGRGNAVTGSTGMSGTLFEGFNLLTPQFKAKFTSDGGTNNSTNSYTGSNRFQLPTKIDTSKPATVEVVFTEATYTIQLPADANSNYLVGSVQIDGKYIGGTLDAYPITYLDVLLYADGTLEFSGTRKNASGGYATLTDGIPAAAASNNITVTAYAVGISSADREKIGKMTRCCWFGGDRSGLAGGTRLFLAGNPAEPNLIHWSDVNKPLYFPENNYAYVGDSSQPVTGFGKQGDLLMIFKESEIYAAQYVAGQSYTAEDVENGKIVDVAAAAAQFPLTPIHPTIGCDCPDTIRLVNNRLCWADSSGYVYMLPTVNQYNERVVREISDNIRRALLTHSKAEWAGAKACEYKGHYLLTVGRRAYLLETNNSSYASYTYYAKETTAQRLLPWYIWEFPAATVALAGDRDRVRLIQGTYAYTLAGGTDDGSAIRSRFVTKLFNFGRPQAGKGIHQLYLIMADAGCTARVSYITEDYTAEDAYLLEAEEDETPYTAGYFRPFRLSPNLHRVREFGIRCESEGRLAVAGLSIDYTMQGVVR